VATIVVAIAPHQQRLLGVAVVDPLLAAMSGLSLIRFDQRRHYFAALERKTTATPKVAANEGSIAATLGVVTIDMKKIKN
jgi:hypothetical protein